MKKIFIFISILIFIFNITAETNRESFNREAELKTYYTINKMKPIGPGDTRFLIFTEIDDISPSSYTSRGMKTELNYNFLKENLSHKISISFVKYYRFYIENRLNTIDKNDDSKISLNIEYSMHHFLLSDWIIEGLDLGIGPKIFLNYQNNLRIITGNDIKINKYLISPSFLGIIRLDRLKNLKVLLILSNGGVFGIRNNYYPNVKKTGSEKIQGSYHDLNWEVKWSLKKTLDINVGYIWKNLREFGNLNDNNVRIDEIYFGINYSIGD
ncbi:MAG: hypothetical protein FXF47_08900 [Candidatus Mcinerneyibacterium aminivorans]|uniref:Uncharacterized protein n=1 Tax=Candidatus Mcinerneyibacterium aminivorans TaxID=2703815 RepID=A0A5D0M9P5_9BACT|nr:MAG: hypothetical protein FXF47_08900 [Candidatus Mcinerneyibacterium aminivorans]